MGLVATVVVGRDGTQGSANRKGCAAHSLICERTLNFETLPAGKRLMSALRAERLERIRGPLFSVEL